MKREENAMLVVQSARKWLGTPYLHQASLIGVGCDCLGLIRGVWREVEGQEPESAPPYSSVWAEVGKNESLLNAGYNHFQNIERADLAPGDVLIFRLRASALAKHAGILTRSDRFIHAYDGASVVESSLDKFWRTRIAGIFRFPCVLQNSYSGEQD